MLSKIHNMHLNGFFIAMFLIGSSVAIGQQSYELTEEGFQPVQELDPNTPGGQLQKIRRLIASDDAGEAVDLATDWIKQFPRHPDLPEAFLLRGDAYVADDDEYKALFDYEFLIRNFPESRHFHTALQREYDIAMLYLGGLKRRLLGMRIIPAASEGSEILIRIQERSPGSQLAEKAGMALADYYYDTAEMQLAALAYGLFIENNPRSNSIERARFRQIEANLATFKAPAYDATGLIEARARLVELAEDDPLAGEKIGSEELIVRIDESLAKKQLLVAEWYQGQDKTVSARTIYRRVITDYPQTAAAYEAALRLHEMDPQLFEKPDAPENIEEARMAPVETSGATDSPAEEKSDQNAENAEN